MMTAAILMGAGCLIALLGYPLGMIAWKPGYAVLAGLIGTALVLIGIGILAGHYFE